MKIIPYALFLITVLVPHSSKANQITWVELDPKFTFHDAGHSCSPMPLPDNYYFVALLDDSGKIIQADIRAISPLFSGVGRFGPESGDAGVFTDAEAAEIVLKQDELGEYWVKSLPLSDRLLRALFTLTDFDNSLDDNCRPPENIAALTPLGTVFNFKPNESTVYYTPEQIFNGYKDDGQPSSVENAFSVGLEFSQQVLMDP